MRAKNTAAIPYGSTARRPVDSAPIPLPGTARRAQEVVVKRFAALSLLQRLGLLAAALGIAGLIFARWFRIEAGLPFSILALLLGALSFSVETVLKREDTVSRGDDATNSYVYGFQAMATGFANALLALVALAAVFGWLVGYGRELAAWAGDNPGAPMAVAGLWLASSQIGVVAGVALSTLDATENTVADRLLNLVNRLVEKFIAVVLSLAGLAFMVLGGVAFTRGWGVGDMLGLLP